MNGYEISDEIRDLQYDVLKGILKRESTRLPDAAWKKLWNAIKKIRPDQAKKLERLENLCVMNQNDYSQESYDIVAMEKDAVGLCLDIFGSDRKQISSLWTPQQDNSPAPFLKNLENANIIEDNMIQHDQNIFGDWAFDKRNQVGAVEFKKDNHKLTILNVNRTSIEHTLGVDLVYYNHTYTAFVMVQYKRMEIEKDNKSGSNNAIYRFADPSYHAEFKRMQDYLDNMPKYSSENITEFRLYHNPFFFKLCPKIIFEPLSNELIKGHCSIVTGII